MSEISRQGDQFNAAIFGDNPRKDIAGPIFTAIVDKYYLEA